MKQLIVYSSGSYYKYNDLYERIVYEIGGDLLLRIHQREQISGEESEISVFKNWDYIKVEEI